MKEYRTGQRLKCTKDFNVLYFPTSFSSLREYTVQPNIEYMLVDIIKHSAKLELDDTFILMPLGERGIPLELCLETVDKYFETCK